MLCTCTVDINKNIRYNIVLLILLINKNLLAAKLFHRLEESFSLAQILLENKDSIDIYRLYIFDEI